MPSTPSRAPDRDAPDPTVSVVIVSWNTRELLRTCVVAVERAAEGLPHEVVVVDNASADGSADLVATRFPGVHLIRNTDNPGYAAACNQGIRQSRGRYVLLLNADAEPHGGSLAGLVDLLEATPRAAATGPLLVNPAGTPVLTYGHFPSLTTALLPLLRPLAPLLGDLHALGVVPAAPRTDAGPRCVDYLSGAALLLRRRALEEVGNLDQQFFLYFEETDLCRRLRDAGWQVIWLPGVSMIHHEGASRDRRSAEALADYYRSLGLYLRKHHRPGYVLLVRGAMLLALAARYVVARLASRHRLAEFYRASAHALRAETHA